MQQVHKQKAQIKAVNFGILWNQLQKDLSVKGLDILPLTHKKCKIEVSSRLPSLEQKRFSKFSFNHMFEAAGILQKARFSSFKS